MSSRLAALLRDKWVLSALAGCFVLQLLYQNTNEKTILTQLGDQSLYRALGTGFSNFWQGDFGPPDLLRTPGYPFFLYVNRTLGVSDSMILLEQAVAISSAALAVVYLAYRLSGIWAARVAAVMFLAYLPLWSYSGLFLTEALSITLTCWAVVCCFEILLGSSHLWKLTAATALLGSLAVIIRPNAIVSLVVTMGFAVFFLRPRVHQLKAVGIFALVFLVIFAPWVVRNLAVEGSPLILGRNGPYTLNLGLHFPVDTDTGEFSAHRRSTRFWGPPHKGRFVAQEAAQISTKDMIAKAFKRPFGFIWSRGILQYQLWMWPAPAREVYGIAEPWLPYWLLTVMHRVILGSGLFGLWTYRRSRLGWLLGALVGATALPYFAYYPEPRYALATFPFLVALASAGLTFRFDKIQEHAHFADGT